MPGFYLSSEDGKPIKDTNPLPVQLAGASSGSAVNVDIIGNTAGLATEAKQDDIIQAIESLAGSSGGDSSSEIFTGSMSVTTSAAALPNQAIAEVLLQNDPDSTEDIFLGDDTTQNFRLKPGEWISMRITNLNLIYAKTSANTATLQYFARGPAGIPGGGSSPVPVQLTGSNIADAQAIPVRQTKKTELSTLLNSQTVSANSDTGLIDVGVTNEDEIWFFVLTNKQPWSLVASTPLIPNPSSIGTMLYPVLMNVTKTYTTNSIPAKALYLGQEISEANGLVDIQTMEEAKVYQVPPAPGTKVKFINGSSEDATVTIRVLRVWR